MPVCMHVLNIAINSLLCEITICSVPSLDLANFLINCNIVIRLLTRRKNMLAYTFSCMCLTSSAMLYISLFPLKPLYDSLREYSIPVLSASDVCK